MSRLVQVLVFSVACVVLHVSCKTCAWVTIVVLAGAPTRVGVLITLQHSSTVLAGHGSLRTLLFCPILLVATSRIGLVSGSRKFIGIENPTHSMFTNPIHTGGKASLQNWIMLRRGGCIALCCYFEPLNTCHDIHNIFVTWTFQSTWCHWCCVVWCCVCFVYIGQYKSFVLGARALVVAAATTTKVVDTASNSINIATALVLATIVIAATTIGYQAKLPFWEYGTGIQE